MRLDFVDLRRVGVQFLIELLGHVGDLVAARVDHLIVAIHLLHALVRLTQACLCHVFKVLEAEDVGLISAHFEPKLLEGLFLLDDVRIDAI